MQLLVLKKPKCATSSKRFAKLHAPRSTTFQPDLVFTALQTRAQESSGGSRGKGHEEDSTKKGKKSSRLVRCSTVTCAWTC